MKRTLLAIVLIVGSVGVSAEEFSRALEAMKDTLIEPDSAKFSNLVLAQRPTMKHDGVICGEVDAKNKKGTYSGKMLFFVAQMLDGTNIVGLADGDKANDMVVNDICSPKDQ